VYVECERKRDIDNNRTDLNYFILTQTLPEQQRAKARNRGITETSHIWHCTQNVENAKVKVQNIYHGRNNITCNRNCKY
jgi:hypothetical protein